MPIIRMADSYSEAAARGTNVRLYHHSPYRTISRFSDNRIYENLNPSIPLDEQPPNGYEYSPLLWLYDTHVGLCIKDYERNGHSDSDWYMVTWNPEKQEPETIEFATTRGWSYPCYFSRPDATPEVLAAYEEYRAKEAEAARIAREAAEKRLPKKGRTVRVVKGRKLPLGTTGVVFWHGCDKYASRFSREARSEYERLGIELEDGTKTFIAAENVEVVAGGAA